MEPNAIESVILDKLDKRIAELFPHGVSISRFPDEQTPPMPWLVRVVLPNHGTRDARGFTLVGALSEAIANR